MPRRTKRGRRPFHGGRHKPSEHRDIPPALPPTTGGRPLSVTEEVYLPNGADSSLAEVASALLNVAHDDLIRRPALLIAQADRILEAVERCRTFADLEQCLSCANYTITSLFNAAVNMGKKPVPRALLNANDIRGAADQLHRELHDKLLGIELPVCPWQRKLLPDMLPPAEPSAQSGNPVAKAYDVLGTKPAGSPIVLRPPDHHSPQVHDPRRGVVSHSLADVLPKNLKLKPNCDTRFDMTIRELQETAFNCAFGAPLPDHFSVAEWSARLLFFPKVDAAAQKVVVLLKKLEELHVNGQRAGGTQESSDAMKRMQERIDAIQAQIDEMKAERLVDAVDTAKNAYCAALMIAIRYPMTVRRMLEATFTASTAPSLDGADEKKIEVERPETHASGGCPLRAALLARAAAAGFPDVDCPEMPPVEAKAHVIPLAAANCLGTSSLLHKIDSMPDHLNTPVGDFLALPHNTFYLSSCFKTFFDSGALVFVKIGPPECQFYRVTTTEKAEAAVIDFGADIQMRHLFSHTTNKLSVINGLVVDFARPAKVISGGVEHDVPRVNERYLDLHARAHNSDFDEPLTTHEHAYPPALSRAVLELCGPRCHRSSGTIATTVKAWLQHVVPYAPEI